MRHLIHLFSALPTVLLGLGLLLYVGGVPATWFNQFEVRVALEVGILVGWLFTVAMTRVYITNNLRQFSLGSLVAFVAIAAIGIAGIVNGSVASFVAILLWTVVALAYTVRAAFNVSVRECRFCRGFATVGCFGLVFSLAARDPISTTWLPRIMWWDATQWGNGFTWNGAAASGVHLLFVTWFAAFTGGWLASLLLKEPRAGGPDGFAFGSGSDQRNSPVD